MPTINVSKEKQHKTMIHAKAASDLSKENSAAEAGKLEQEGCVKAGRENQGAHTIPRAHKTFKSLKRNKTSV